MKARAVTASRQQTYVADRAPGSQAAVWRGAVTELRRSTASRVFPLLVAGLWFFAVVHMPVDILGQGNNVVLYVHVAGIIIIGITASAIAAWEVTRARRTGFVELERSSSRNRSRLLLRTTAPVLAWAWLAYLAVQGAALVRSLSVRAHLPNPTVILLTLAFITALVGWGALCGSLLPAPVAPFVAAGAAYLGAVVQSVYSYNSAVARLFPVLQERWDPAMKPNVVRLLMASLWLVLLGVALHSLAARDRRMLLKTPAIALMAGLTLAGAPLVTPPVTPSESFYGKSRDDSDPHTCQDLPAGGRVCLYAADAGWLPTFVAGYENAREAAGELQTFPRTVAGEGLTGPAPVMAYVMLERPTLDRVTAAILDYTAAPISPAPETCPSPPSSSLIGEDDLSHVIQVFLHDRAGLPAGRLFGERSRLLRERLEQLDRPTQNHWLEQAISAYAHCRAPKSPPEP